MNLEHGTSNIQPEECSFNVPRHTVPGDAMEISFLPRLNIPQSTAGRCGQYFCIRKFLQVQIEVKIWVRNFVIIWKSCQETRT